MNVLRKSYSVFLKLTLRSLRERSPQGLPRQESLHLSPSKHSLLACSIPPPSSGTSFTHLLLNPSLPSSKWPSSVTRTLHFTHIHFLHELFTLKPLNMAKPPQCISFLPIPPFHTLLHLHKLHCRILLTHFHCSRLPILSLHMPLSDNSFPQHSLLTAVPSSTPKSLIYTSVLAGKCCSLNLFLPP